jgi:hypothetical protein
MAKEQFDVDAAKILRALLKRFRGATLDMLQEVLLPLQVPLVEVGVDIKRFGPGYAVTFQVEVGTEDPSITRGRSGKVIPKDAANGDAVWQELLKARIHEAKAGHAVGELHGGNKGELTEKLQKVRAGDVLEIDRYGITAKLESALTEVAFVRHAQLAGYKVTRMPEDIARHLGDYWHFDFLLEKDGITKRVECKSLWGTNTKYARLIHSKGGNYETSSCKFATQDIFAVNMWLRTGAITDIAFARSVQRDEAHPYGLPVATGRGGGPLPEYVHQNPVCSIGDGVWFQSINDVWNLP